MKPDVFEWRNCSDYFTSIGVNWFLYVCSGKLTTVHLSGDFRECENEKICEQNEC